MSASFMAVVVLLAVVGISHLCLAAIGIREISSNKKRRG